MPIIDRLRDPKEKTAWLWLAILSVPAWLGVIAWCVFSFGLGLVIIGFIWFIRFIAENLMAASIRANSVEVSAEQLPELNRIVDESCRKLGLARPSVYVMQHNLWNAFAAKVTGRRFVVLFSGAIDSLLLKGDLNQLTFVVGHELGHHAAGHLDFSKTWVTLGGWVPWLYLWYSRRREFTCDRAGLYCTGDLATSLEAMKNMTVGAQLAGQVSVPGAIRQWEKCQNEFFVRYRTLYSTHPHLLCRLNTLQNAALELGIPMQLSRSVAQPPRLEDPSRYMPPGMAPA